MERVLQEHQQPEDVLQAKNLVLLKVGDLARLNMPPGYYHIRLITRKLPAGPFNILSYEWIWHSFGSKKTSFESKIVGLILYHMSDTSYYWRDYSVVLIREKQFIIKNSWLTKI